MEPTRESLWTKDFTLLWIANFLMALGFYFLLPTLPEYALKALGANKSQVGYIIGVYTLAALAVRPLAGYALDSLGRRKVYLLALAVFALLIGPYYLVTNILFLLLLRVAHGVSWGVTTTGGGTIVADILPLQRRGEGVGYFGLSMTVAMALGPGAGLWLMGDDNFGRLFGASALCVAAAFILASFISYPKVPLTKRSLSWHSFVENRVLPISLVMFLTTLVYGGIVSFIAIYGKEIGIKNGGLFFLAYAVSLSLVRPYAGKLQDRQGPRQVITLGFLCLMAGFFILSASRGISLFLAAALVLGAGNGMIWPTLQAMIINMVEPHRRGVANSTYMSALDLGIGGGSMILGWLAEVTSTATMYFFSGMMLLLPLSYFLAYVVKDYNRKISSGGNSHA